MNRLYKDAQSALAGLDVAADGMHLVDLATDVGLDEVRVKTDAPFLSTTKV